MGRFFRNLASVALAACGCASEVSAATVSDWLALPPAFRKLFGDSVLVIEPVPKGKERVTLFGVGEFSPKGGFEREVIRPRAVIRASSNESESDLATRLAEELSERFYEEVLASDVLTRHERRMRMGEIVPLDEEEFVRLSTRKLMGFGSIPQWFDSWWTIRMGLPMSPSAEYRLALINLHFDYEGDKEAAGHFCFGLRKVGGEAERDLVFDFRAQWYLDRPPTAMEGMNVANVLPLQGFTENLYDWLYTQTEYRHCYVDLWFLPVSREQVALLYHFHDEIGIHEGGQFKGIRKNCASLGLAFLDRIKPFDSPLPLGEGIADFPKASAMKYLEPYGEVPHVRIQSVTRDLGREPTAKSKVHRAQPSRATTRSYRELSRYASVN